jgi:integrase
VVACREENDKLARRRGIQQPKVYRDGDLWKLRCYRDAINAKGELYRARPEFTIGPATGPGKLSEKQAGIVAYETVLKQLNSYASVPQSIITLNQFIAQKFQPNCIDNMKHAGQQHYGYCLKKILPVLGEERMRDIDTQRIQNVCRSLLNSGKSVQTATHIRNALSAIFTHAKEQRFYVGENPAQLVKLPALVHAERYAYSFSEAETVLEHLREMGKFQERIMALLSMTTSLNIAELCGLRWKRLNLTGGIVQSGGEAVPPYSLIVREDYYRGKWGTTKTSSRRRTIGIPDAVVADMLELKRISPFHAADDVVFASSIGTPLDAHNVANRVFRPLAAKLGFPISWHIFRHSAATFCEHVDMPLSDRVKLMGHAAAKMTGHYTHSEVMRRRTYQNRIASQLLPPKSDVELPVPEATDKESIAELERIFKLKTEETK